MWPWRWSSGQRASLLLRRSKFEACSFNSVNCLKRTKKRPGITPFLWAENCQLYSEYSSMLSLYLYGSWAVWPDWAILKVFETNIRTKVTQMYINFFENIPFQVKTVMATFWVTFGRNWTTFYIRIWSHWSWVPPKWSHLWAHCHLLPQLLDIPSLLLDHELHRVHLLVSQNSDGFSLEKVSFGLDAVSRKWAAQSISEACKTTFIGKADFVEKNFVANTDWKSKGIKFQAK